VVPALSADTAGSAVSAAVVDVVGKQTRDRGRLTGQEYRQGGYWVALRSAHEVEASSGGRDV
jgi:hypothetical protein